MKALLCLIPLMLTLSAQAASEDLLAGFFKKLQAGEKQTVVAYGTSLTAGGAWVASMKQWFEEKYPGQVTVVNSGGPGQNSDWGAANVQGKVVANNPNLVIIEFSYNDAHQKFKLTPEHCKGNLEKILSAITSKDPTTAIVLQTMNVPWDPAGGKDPAANRPELETYNDNYRNAAKAHGFPLVDNYPVWLKIKETDPKRYEAILPDGSHPNKAASEEVTWANVKAVLEKAAL